MLLTYLILAHLLGDFIFQPASLVKYKMRSYKGILLHVFIHFLLNVLILLPFLLNGYTWLFYVIIWICFAHYWIDYLKINYDLHHDKKVQPFIIDQLLHLLTLLISYFFVENETLYLQVSNWFFNFYTNVYIILFFSFLVFITTVIEIYNFQRNRENNPKSRYYLKPQSIANRIIVFTVIYVLFTFLSYYATR